MRNFLFLVALLSMAGLRAQTDTIPADMGAITLTPIMHSSMVLEWNGKTIFVDPYGGGERFAGFSAPDLVIITDIHGDHLHKGTLQDLSLGQAELIAPQAVIDLMEEDAGKFKQTHVLANGEQTSWGEIRVEAVPMYNLPETEDSRHPKGRGNGYVLTVGGKRLYISGDTEDIPEMRQLKDIDVAFVCMNLPYTMDVNQAADAVLDFQPKWVYPFHYRGSGGSFSDVAKFRDLVLQGNNKIEVRLLDWYPAH